MTTTSDLYPEAGTLIYLNHAGVSRVPHPSAVAAKRALDASQQNGLEFAKDAFTQRERFKKKLGAWLGIKDTLIALVPSVTKSAIDVASHLTWKAGDSIVLFKGEFPANVYPWLATAKQHHLNVVWLDSKDFDQDTLPTSFESVLRLHRPKLVAVSLVQFQSGLRMPVEDMQALCHKHHSLLFVDAIQGLGAVDVDITSLDFVGGGSHKWMLGSEGAGFLICSEHGASHLSNVGHGWLSIPDPFSFFREGEVLHYDHPCLASPKHLETSSLNALGYVILESSLDILMAHGIANTQLQISSYLNRLEEELVPLGFQSTRSRTPNRRSGILSVKPPPSMPVESWVERMAHEGVILASPCGLLRFSPHFFNDLNEIPELIRSIKTVHKKQFSSS